jgi:TatD DNase family protein
MYIDFHTHKPLSDGQDSILEVISMHGQIKYENTFFTIGYHPWWSFDILNEVQVEVIKTALQNKYCLGIGECGLDKLKGADASIQEALFLQHIHLANELDVPLIIHCVRQYDQVLKLRKKYGNTPWVIHGYRRNNQLAKSLIDQGIKLSVAPFAQMNQSFAECLQFLPCDAFFIETDSDYSHTIKERYTMMAEIKKMNIFDLQNQMIENFTNFFKWKKTNFTGLSVQNF